MNEINPAKTRMVLELKQPSPLLSCRFDPTGRFVFAGAQDSKLHRWDLASKQHVALVGHRSWVRGLAFQAERRKLLSGDYAGKVLVWSVDAENPTPERTIDAHRGWVRGVAVSPDGKIFATCGNDHLVKLWSFPDGRLIRELPGHAHHVYTVAFHPGGQFLVSGDLHGIVKQWEVASGREIRTLDASVLFKYDPVFRADHGGVRSMAFDAAGTQLACSGITEVSNAFAGVGKPAIVLFDWQNGKTKQVLRPQAAFQGTAWGVGFHPSGVIVGVGGGSGGALWFWNAGSAQSSHTLALPNNARDMHLHPDGRRLAIAFFDGAVRIYDMAN